MKTKNVVILSASLLCSCLFPGCSPGQESSLCEGGSEYYFGVEIDGVLCGYSVEKVCPGKKEGQRILSETSDVKVKLSVLGAGLDLIIQIRAEVDPVTERLTYNETRVTTGNATIVSSSTIMGDTVWFRSNSVPGPKKIPITPDVILDIPLKSPYLFRDFIQGGASEKKYRVYEPIRGEIIEKGYKVIGDEEWVVNDSVFQTLVVEEMDFSTMTRSKIWLNKQDGFQLKILVAGRHIYLADRSVMKKIDVVNYDNVIFARVNKIIPDFQHMTYLKVRASIRQ